MYHILSIFSNSALISNFPKRSVTSSRFCFLTVSGTGTGSSVGGLSSTLPTCDKGVSRPLMLGDPRPLTLADIMSEKLSLMSFSKSLSWSNE